MYIRLVGALLLAACSQTTLDDPPRDDTSADAECVVVDCDDPACADVEECTWPSAIVLLSEVDFAGATIDCFSLPIDIDDCATEATAELAPITQGACPACDKTFAGPLIYGKDTCSELGDLDLPTEAAAGFVFVSDTEREVWSRDESGSWSKSADMVGNEGVFVLTTTEDVALEIAECGGREQTVGALTAVLTFTDVD